MTTYYGLYGNNRNYDITITTEHRNYVEMSSLDGQPAGAGSGAGPVAVAV
jgi:hypothetical protein